jgi:hypothetical protein
MTCSVRLASLYYGVNCGVNCALRRVTEGPVALSRRYLQDNRAFSAPQGNVSLTTQTREQIAEGYRSAMGDELGTLFDALNAELIWVHWRWKQYRILFGDEPSRIDMLNEAAPFFFYTMQEVLFEDTLLALARLVAPEKSAGQASLTIRRLPGLIASNDLRDKAKTLVAAAISAATFATDWRHRRLAHRDLALSLNRPARALEPASRQAVEDALRALRTLLNELEARYLDATTGYELSSHIGDAEALLHVLRDGLQKREERLARWNRGEIDASELTGPAV